MKTRKLKLLSTGGYFFAFLALGLFSGLLGPTLPLLADALGVALGDMGIVFSAGALGYLTGSLFGGKLYDHLPGHPILSLSLILVAIVIGSIPFIPLLGLLVLAIYCMGCLKGCIDVGCNTLLIWLHKGELSAMMNALHMLFAFGAFICPLAMAPWLEKEGSLLFIYPLVGLIALPAGIVFLFLKSPAIPGQTSLSGDISSGVSDRREKPARFLPVMVMVLAFFFYVGVEVSYGGWLASYVIRKDFGGEGTGAYLTSVYWGLFLFGRILAIFTGKKIRASRMLCLDLLGAALSLLLLMLFSDSFFILILASGLMGLSLASIFPTFLLYADNRMTLSGSINRWFFIGASAGAMVLPLLVGMLFDHVGLHFFAPCLLLALAGTGLMIALFDKVSQGIWE